MRRSNETTDRSLRLSALERSVECHDPQLATLLGHIAGRRSRRGRVTTSVRDTSTLSGDVRIFRLARPAGFSFRAGQHVKLRLADVPKARSYSIASAPHDPQLEFCIERVEGGRFTPRLFAGSTTLEIASAAKGKFVLAAGASVHLMVATVTGIAPMRSMLRHALHTGVAGRFVVLHGASHADELPYREELEALAAREERVRYVPTVSRPTEARNRGFTGRHCRVDDLMLAELGQLGSGVHAYACGNGGMVRRVRDELSRRGIPVSTESFGG